jgi:hypothetical protein
MKRVNDILQLIVMLLLLPFVVLYRLIIIALLTIWIWGIPLAILIWAIK